MMRIHDVISVAHLEPATDPAEGPYRRRRLPMPPTAINSEDEYEIKVLSEVSAEEIAGPHSTSVVGYSMDRKTTPERQSAKLEDMQTT